MYSLIGARVFNTDLMNLHLLQLDETIDNHKLFLIKCLIEKYVEIRLFHDSKKFPNQKNIRHKLNKLILFNNQ